MASSGDEGFGLPSPRRCSMRTSPAPITTTPWMENALAALVTTTAPPRTVAPWLIASLPFKRKPFLGSQPPSKGQRHGKASSLASKPLPWSNCTRRRGMSQCSRRRGSGWWTLPPLKLRPRRWLPLSATRGQAEAVVAKPPSASRPLIDDEVDKMYHQLVEIHSISTTQLAECACWLRSDSTPCPVQAGTDCPKSIVMPSTIRLAPSPPTNFSSQAPPW
jgi:hypothetical protein